MSVMICTMPECQTTAGCQCGNQIVKTPINTLVSILDAKDAEISKLKAELETAMEIISFTAQHGAFPSGVNHRARAFLSKHQRAE